MSPVETAAEIRRGAAKDLTGVPLLLAVPILPTGAILFAELIVGRMADWVDKGREIDPKEGDFETLLLLFNTRTDPEALDNGLLSSLSESIGYKREKNKEKVNERTFTGCTLVKV